MTADTTINKARETIQNHSLRATSSRLAVLGLLMERGEPMSHAEVFEALGVEQWDRTTIYRNLVDMSDVGILRRWELGDRVWRFEFVDHHHHESEHPHFVCTDCGKVTCLPELILSNVPTSSPVAVKHGEVEIQLRGVCDECH